MTIQLFFQCFLIFFSDVFFSDASPKSEAVKKVRVKLPPPPVTDRNCAFTAGQCK